MLTTPTIRICICSGSTGATSAHDLGCSPSLRIENLVCDKDSYESKGGVTTKLAGRLHRRKAPLI